MTALETADLRRAPVTAIRSRDLRAPERDLWSDEAALWDRMTGSWAGLDDAAWHLPGAAPSDAGGADWSLAEHVGHIADWQELAIDVHGPRAWTRASGRRTATTTTATSTPTTNAGVSRGPRSRATRSLTVSRLPARACWPWPTA